MKLETIKISNFRSYRDTVEVRIDDITAFIGRNDIGKSTILEALEIFFNSQVVKIDASDACVHGTSKEVRIGCVFSELPSEIIIDSSAQTSLADEYLLNSEGKLEIHKVYDCNLKNPKEAIYAKALHPTASGVDDLLQLQNAGLKQRAHELDVDTSILDTRKNSVLRQALWKAVDDLQLTTRDIALDSSDGKKIWEAIKANLPIYALFQADRASKDDDSEIQDPMKYAIAEAILEVQPQLDVVKAAVEKRATEVAHRTVNKLREMDANLAGQLAPRFKAEPRWDSLFKISLTGDDDIPLNKRGSGVRRLVLLNFFRAEAERRHQENAARGIIYAIEEPETSQHPSNQRAIVHALLELASAHNTQVIITTHVPGLTGLLPVEAIRYIDDAPQPQDRRIRYGTEDVYRAVADDLGMIPDNRVRVLLCVEGPHDIRFLTTISEILSARESDLPNLATDPRIALLPLGGSTLNEWVRSHYLRELNRIEYHIYDRDDGKTPKNQKACDMINARRDGSSARLTRKRELENYIHPEAIRAEFELEIVHGPDDDVPQLVARAVHEASDTDKLWDELSPDKRKQKISQAKRRLNEGAVKHMTPELLTEIDQDDEIRTWLREIQAAL